MRKKYDTNRQSLACDDYRIHGIMGGATLGGGGAAALATGVLAPTPSTLFWSLHLHFFNDD